jgi:DNA-binding transcriptional ArsR family regulator
MTAVSEALKGLSNPTRRQVLTWLKAPEVHFRDYTQLYPFAVHGVCASLVQDKAGLSQPATSLCLKALNDLDLVVATKVGKWTYYRCNEQRLQAVLAQLLAELELESVLEVPAA